MAIRTVAHPLARVLMTGLRDARTGPAEFRAKADLLAELILVEATRGLPVRPTRVETPLAEADGCGFAQGLAVVPVLRAGLAMLQAALRLFPDVAVGYIGLERSHDTAVAASYYCKLPSFTNRHTLLVDPMLATGGSASQAASLLKHAGAGTIGLACVVASEEGAARMQKEHPDVEVVAAAIDPTLDANKYIVPGLGDFGDRLYGTL